MNKLLLRQARGIQAAFYQRYWAAAQRRIDAAVNKQLDISMSAGSGGKTIGSAKRRPANDLDQKLRQMIEARTEERIEQESAGLDLAKAAGYRSVVSDMALSAAIAEPIVPAADENEWARFFPGARRRD